MEKSNLLFWHILILASGLGVFLIQMTFSRDVNLFFKISLSAILLLLSVFFLKKHQIKKIGYILSLFSIASIAILTSAQIGNWGLLVFNLNTSTYTGQAVAKFSETLPIIFIVLISIKFINLDYNTIYLQKGKLKKSLLIGFSFFTGFTIITLLFGAVNPLFQEKFQSNGLSFLIRVFPWAILFSLSNGFMEELLFRGLFLKRFESVIGFRSSNIITAVIFAVSHLQVTYTSYMIIFLIITFVLGLFCGSIMKKTDSIIAPMLIHAGADMMMILPSFTNML